ncbi:heat shock protein 86 family protein, putative [Plasmodium gallinaceum]|uniref:Heat shock protein 86 family protein, putative n=1 Tax=Plasmodium gallinaceum TaxID=5849 RepID=A0A1J1H020_PLAGA|nr:heat shock protein 86 family protein, putative [Plasmodium gallinaceum]CRG98052.1 heat shock protein 86 family protein, putative [Plasmodium gallinaceum]
MKSNELDRKKSSSSSNGYEDLRKSKDRVKNTNNNIDNVRINKKDNEKNSMKIKEKLKKLKHHSKRENSNSMIYQKNHLRKKENYSEKYEIEKSNSSNTSDLLVNKKDKQKIRENLIKKLEKFKRENRIYDNKYKSSSNDQNSFSDKESSSSDKRKEIINKHRRHTTSVSRSISENRSTFTSYSNSSAFTKSERSNTGSSFYEKKKHSSRKSFSRDSKDNSRDNNNIKTKRRNTNIYNKSLSRSLSSASLQNSYTKSHKEIISNDMDNSFKKKEKKKRNFDHEDNDYLYNKNDETKYKLDEKHHNNIHKKKKFSHNDNMTFNKAGRNSKYLYNKITGEKIEVKYSRVPLGYHTTKESWMNYTKWLQKKNDYRFSLHFDEHKIFRKSSSLSPTTWENYVKISEDEDEGEDENEDKKKEKTEEINEKIENKGKEENTEENKKNELNNKSKDKKLKKEHDNNTLESSRDLTISSSVSYDKIESVNSKKKKVKKHSSKSRKEKKNEEKKKKKKIKKYHIDKKNYKEHKLHKEKKKEKKRKKHHKKDDSLDKKRNKRKHKSHKKNKLKDNKKYDKKNRSKYKKNRKHLTNTDSDEGNESDTSEQTSTSVTSLSFLNEEYDFVDKNMTIENKKNKEQVREDSCDFIKDNQINKREEENKENKLENIPKEKTKECEENVFYKNNNLKIIEKEISCEKDKTDKEAYLYSDKSSDNESLGPKPLDVNVKLANRQIDYGVAMMPGEGQAIAQFVQKGKRIPRRGEVGLSAEAIENFESLGYVMSGSRHKRMNAIRMRKENQVYSAEEQRALAMFNYEERTNRENALINDLKEILRKQNEAILNETINKNDNN